MSARDNFLNLHQRPTLYVFVYLFSSRTCHLTLRSNRIAACQLNCVWSYWKSNPCPFVHKFSLDFYDVNDFSSFSNICKIFQAFLNFWIEIFILVTVEKNMIKQWYNIPYVRLFVLYFKKNRYSTYRLLFYQVSSSFPVCIGTCICAIDFFKFVINFISIEMRR